ncbi:YnfU family zinc-binding protein [Brenneria izadpanahii]|uniref:YnfU family zinc-binding protein n=1 Tax=Brenneria izadpanahii TaxID=2722756 RepID=UPI0031B599F4
MHLLVKHMFIFNSLKMFRDTSIEVTCPKCAQASEQNQSRFRKNIIMICPHCGHYFQRVLDKDLKKNS